MTLLGIMTTIGVTATVSVVIGYRLGSQRYAKTAKTIHELKKELGSVISTRKTWKSGELQAQVRILINRILTQRI